MTRYSVHGSRQELLATWTDGGGDTTVTVTVRPAWMPAETMNEVARVLTSLSAALWSVYTRPRSTAEDSGQDSQTREPPRIVFPPVVAMLADPPDPLDFRRIPVVFDGVYTVDRVCCG